MFGWFKKYKIETVAVPVPRSMEVLRLKKGDTLVIQYAGRLSREQVKYLAEAAKPYVPKGAKVFVADESISFAKIERPATITKRKRRQ